MEGKQKQEIRKEETWMDFSDEWKETMANGFGFCLDAQIFGGGGGGAVHGHCGK